MKVSWTNWDDGEPNYSSDQSCFAMSYGLWRDVECKAEAVAACEVPAGMSLPCSSQLFMYVLWHSLVEGCNGSISVKNDGQCYFE